MKPQTLQVRALTLILFGIVTGASFTRLLSPIAGGAEYPVPVPGIAEIGPARRLTPVTPNDNADLPIVARAIYVGVGGNIQVLAVDDTVAQPIQNVASGSTLSIRAKRIYSTGTTASGIIELD